jgi:hypothetical protein
MPQLTLATAMAIASAQAAGGADVMHPPALDRLPAGAIQPKGWLLAQANLQSNGMTGRQQRLSEIKAVAVGEALVKRAAHLNCHGVRAYLVFAFADALACWEYHPDQYEIVYRGCVGGATPKIKSSASVPTEYLTTIITKEDANREPEESHAPGIHHVQTVPQATAQDA